MRAPMGDPTPLKHLLARRAAITVPGAANALFARVIEDLGFEAVYVTGAGVANMLLGAPDIGFGNAVNMLRTVRTLERAGASGIQIEDQVFPKKCGHFAGKNVIEADEMVQKIKAAADARR